MPLSLVVPSEGEREVVAQADDRLAALGALPVEAQPEVLVFLFRVERIPLRFALAGALEPPVPTGPVLQAAGFGRPPAEIEARVERRETLIGLVHLRRRRVRRRQFLDPDVAEVALRALGLEADVALARIALLAARNFLAVHFELDGSVVDGDPVVIPLTDGIGALLAREAAHPAFRMGTVGLERGAVDREDVAVAGPRAVRAVAVKDLDLVALGEGRPLRRE